MLKAELVGYLHGSAVAVVLMGSFLVDVRFGAFSTRQQALDHDFIKKNFCQVPKRPRQIGFAALKSLQIPSAYVLEQSLILKARIRTREATNLPNF